MLCARPLSQIHLPIYVQHSNKRVLFDSRMEGLIDMIYNPAKELGINVLGQSITGIRGLQLRDGFDVCLCGGSQFPVAEPVTHLLIVHAHKVREDAERFMLGLKKRVGYFLWSNQSNKNLLKNTNKEVINKTQQFLCYNEHPDHLKLIGDNNQSSIRPASRQHFIISSTAHFTNYIFLCLFTVFAYIGLRAPSFSQSIRRSVRLSTNIYRMPMICQ